MHSVSSYILLSVRNLQCNNMEYSKVVLQGSHCEKVLFYPGSGLSAGKWPTDGDSLYYVHMYVHPEKGIF